MTQRDLAMAVDPPLTQSFLSRLESGMAVNHETPELLIAIATALQAPDLLMEYCRHYIMPAAQEMYGVPATEPIDKLLVKDLHKQALSSLEQISQFSAAAPGVYDQDYHLHVLLVWRETDKLMKLIKTFRLLYGSNL